MMNLLMESFVGCSRNRFSFFFLIVFRYSEGKGKG